MELYHVSPRRLDVGQIIKSDDFEKTKYYENAIAKDKNWIDDFLDENRPENFPERRKTLFAFDSIANCGAFKKNRFNKKIYYYKVKMKCSIPCPMCLIDALTKDDDNRNIKIRQEYWKPTKEWSFLEYLSTEMKVIELVSQPDIIKINIGNNNYQRDRELIGRIF